MWKPCCYEAPFTFWVVVMVEKCQLWSTLYMFLSGTVYLCLANFVICTVQLTEVSAEQLSSTCVTLSILVMQQFIDKIHVRYLARQLHSEMTSTSCTSQNWLNIIFGLNTGQFMASCTVLLFKPERFKLDGNLFVCSHYFIKGHRFGSRLYRPVGSTCRVSFLCLFSLYYPSVPSM